MNGWDPNAHPQIQTPVIFEVDFRGWVKSHSRIKFKAGLEWFTPEVESRD